METKTTLSNSPLANGKTVNSNFSLEEKILLEKRVSVVSEKDRIGPTTDLFFHELVEKESLPKRMFESIAGALGFIYFLVTLPGFSLLTLITAGRPIFVTETFIGYKGKKLTRYQYRIHKSDNKNELTIFGQFLKLTGLYKLPNFINVLSGDMGLVGPQPLPLEKSEILNKKFTDFYKRFATKPGLIEVRNGRSWDLDQDSDVLNESLEKELKYLVNPTLKKDLQVIRGSFDFPAPKN